MRKFRLRIGNRIFGGFLVLIVLFTINAVIIFITGNKIDEVVSKSSNVIRPSQEAINEFILLVTRSKMLVTNWVYLQSNIDDKEALKDLHNFEYPALKEKLQKLKPTWEVDSQKTKLDSAFVDFEQLLEVQKEIMGQLVTFENYEDPITKLLAEDALESQIIPQSAFIIRNLDAIAAIQNNTTADSDVELIEATLQLRRVTILLGIITVAIGLLSSYFMAKSITRPINYIKNVVVKLGRGELVEEKGKKFSNDEIGEMAEATEKLVDGLKSTTFFAENIGNGKYDTKYNPLSEHDVLGNALIEMKDNLERVAEEDKKRNWSTEGLARFGEILRRNNENIEKLSEQIVGNLVKYLEANQGALYIVENLESEEDPFMTMTACYAWDRKKFLEHKIYKGEGLAGQVWQEGDTIYLTDVPDNYVKITSGLGDSNPTAVLIVPLKVNEEIHGVVELASFSDFKDFEIEFVEKIAESIASTISSVKINAKTQHLLTESQEMTEQMRAQEEEMRQNMEELQATQEEMARNQVETEATLDVINKSLMTVEFDTNGKITNVNDNFIRLVGYSKDELIGEQYKVLMSADAKNSDEYKKFWKDLADGHPKSGEFERRAKSGKTLWFHADYTPIKSREGQVYKILKIAYDITQLKDATQVQAQAPA